MSMVSSQWTSFPLNLVVNFWFICACKTISFLFPSVFSFVSVLTHQAKSDTLSPLLKFFPSRAGTPAGKIFFPNSPCPSPTPLFQQLYLALAHFDRLTPEVKKLVANADTGIAKTQRSSSFSSLALEELSPSVIRRQSCPSGKPNIRISNELDKS